MMRCNFFLWISCLQLTLNIATAHAQDATEQLVVGTWGGPYEEAQRAALFTPFEASSGVAVLTSDYSGGLEVFDSPSSPDVLDMLEADAEVACRQGQLQRMNHSDLSEAVLDAGTGMKSLVAAPDGFDARDFHNGAFGRCSVAHLSFSTVLAYNEQAFPGEKPSTINDLFDLERFPGKRALQRSPAALFEWAMMAEGVPTSQIYDLLSTERGLRLVLKRLEPLRHQVIWWDTPSEAVALLERGDVVMASGYNGRFFDAWSRGVPINMIWDGQIIDRSVWVIPSAAKVSRARALSFIRFALHPERLAHLARQIPYGPLRISAFRYIGLHPESGVVMSDHLPTADHHLANALHRDTRWYARTGRLRQEYFDRWINALQDRDDS